MIVSAFSGVSAGLPVVICTVWREMLVVGSMIALITWLPRENSSKLFGARMSREIVPRKRSADTGE